MRCSIVGISARRGPLHPSTDDIDVDWVMGTAEEPKSWMTPIKEYLLNGILPTDPKKRKKLLRKASLFLMQDGRLYRRGFSMPLLRCVTRSVSRIYLAELHGEKCGGHPGGQTLAKTILRYGYFWPEMNRDSVEYTRKCDRCQKVCQDSTSTIHQINSNGQPMGISFAVWGIDLIGALPTAKSSMKYAIVVVDYFTKWAEVELLATITSKEAINFVLENIICLVYLKR